MSSSPPPKGCNPNDQKTALRWLEAMGWSPSSSPTPHMLNSAASGLSADASRLTAKRNCALFMVVARELSAKFRVDVTVRWDNQKTSWGPLNLHWDGDPNNRVSKSLPALNSTSLNTEVRDLQHTMRNVSAATMAEADNPQAFIAAAMSIREDTGPFTGELLDTAMLLGGLLVHDMKVQMDIPRPDDPHWGVDRVTTPYIETPPYRSYPGGHALQLSLLRKLLKHVAGTALGTARVAMLDRLVDQMIDHRRLAGVHTPTDNKDGIELGEWIADRLTSVETNSTDFPAWASLVELAKKEWA